MKKVSLLILISTGVSALFAFQNCSKVPLEAESRSQVYYASANGKICLTGSYDKYTVDSFYVVNLNTSFKDAELQADSDADGLSDADEVQKGFDPLNRRTSSQLLDSICLDLSGSNDCAANKPSCTNTPNKFGLTDCDYKSLGLQQLYQHPDQGLDSDKDGIPDLIEVLRGTLPNVADDTGDPDHDLILNKTEITKGTNPLYADNNDSLSTRVISSISKNTGDKSCTGESWTMKIDQVPFVPVEEFTDPYDKMVPAGGLTLSHEKDENIAVVVLKIRPLLGTAGNAIILFKSLRLAPPTGLDFSLDFSQFSKAGEVQP